MSRKSNPAMCRRINKECRKVIEAKKKPAQLVTHDPAFNQTEVAELQLELTEVNKLIAHHREHLHKAKSEEAAAMKIAPQKEEHKKEKATFIKNRQKFAMIVVVELDKCEQRKKELKRQIAKLTAN